MIRPEATTIAPIGTSPCLPAARAWRSAAPIHAWSSERTGPSLARRKKTTAPEGRRPPSPSDAPGGPACGGLVHHERAVMGPVLEAPGLRAAELEGAWMIRRALDHGRLFVAELLVDVEVAELDAVRAVPADEGDLDALAPLDAQRARGDLPFVGGDVELLHLARRHGFRRRRATVLVTLLIGLIGGDRNSGRDHQHSQRQKRASQESRSHAFLLPRRIRTGAVRRPVARLYPPTRKMLVAAS